MRKTVSIGTYNRIKKFFGQNPKDSYTVTWLRNSLKIDYQSVQHCLILLHKEKIISRKANRYKAKLPDSHTVTTG